MKSHSFNLLVVFILLFSLFSSAVNTVNVHALSNTPLVNLPTTNGTVYVVVPDGTGGIYIGGYFTQLTPVNGGGDVARNNIAHINDDGSIDLTWDPNPNAIVFTIIVSGNTVYVGGGFTTISGQNRNRIAALDKATGNATTWNPNANDYVYIISVSGSTVYVGGDFTSIGGQSRNSIAALNTSTGNATAWDPNANNPGIPLSNPYVETLIVSGNTVYVGGMFTNVGGQNRNNIAALDMTTGNATAWNPNANFDVTTLEASGGVMYVGGYFTSIGGQSRNYIAALDMTTGNAIQWDPNANNFVYTILVNGSTVYAGGEFTNVGGQNRNYIAALDAMTGNATTWNPNASNRVFTLAASGSTFYTGGNFTSIGGQSRPNFAAFSLEATVFSHTLQANYTGTGPSNFTVTFSEDVYDPNGDTDTDDVTNPNNYVLVEQGSVSGFQTTACNNIDAVNDTRIILSGITYIPNTAIVNLSSTLPIGTYRLFICGTTSIVDLVGNPINGGVDSTFNFTVSAAAAATTRSGTPSASSLPDTGFAPNKITTLPAQPANLAYSNLGDLWLEIPSLNVKSSIVGVPQNADKTWDVTWLGNDTGWLNGTAFPTWNGNSVLTAHVTNADGSEGPFAALTSLQYGDQVIVHMGGAQYIYEVRNTKLARPYSTSFAFQSLQDHSYLTLITCQGYNPLNESYLFRRVVRAVLVEVK